MATANFRQGRKPLSTPVKYDVDVTAADTTLAGCMECSSMQRRMTRVRSARSALTVDGLQQRTNSTSAFFCGSPERAIVGRLCTERPLRPRSLRAGSGRIPDARFERGNHVAPTTSPYKHSVT